MPRRRRQSQRLPPGLLPTGAQRDSRRPGRAGPVSGEDQGVHDLDGGCLLGSSAAVVQSSQPNYLSEVCVLGRSEELDLSRLIGGRARLSQDHNVCVFYIVGYLH